MSEPRGEQSNGARICRVAPETEKRKTTALQPKQTFGQCEWAHSTAAHSKRVGEEECWHISRATSALT
jgi:hypothetical protein